MDRSGTLKTDGRFFTRRTDIDSVGESRGIGITQSLLDQLQKAGCHQIVVIFRRGDGSDEVLLADLDDYRCHGRWMKRDGHNDEIVLPFFRFKKKGSETQKELHAY